MKETLKYKYGYINLDVDNLYFSKSGNWMDVKGLKEKGIVNSISQKRRNSYLFMLIFPLICFWIFYKGINSFGEVVLLGFILIPAVLFIILNFREAFYENFKLPRTKILELIDEKEYIKIKFLDAGDEVCVKSIEKLDPRGLEVLRSITN